MKDHSKLVLEIYRHLYREAEPPADFDELTRTGEAKRPDFFASYYLSQDRQDEIVREHCRGMSRWERRRVEAAVALGCSPIG